MSAKAVVTPEMITKMAEMAQAGATLEEISVGLKQSTRHFMQVVFRNTEFKAAFREARNVRADNLIREIMHDVCQPVATLKTPRGEIPNMAEVQRLRIKVDLWKWVASRMDRPAWGERVDVNATVEHTNASPLAQLRALGTGAAAIPPPTKGPVIDIDPATDDEADSLGIDSML